MRSKALGEQAVRQVFEGATIVRPTVFFGPEDRLINSMGQMLRYWPAYPLLAPQQKLQPVFYNDVANAIVNAVSDDSTVGKTYDLGGPTVYTNEELMQLASTLVGIKPNLVLRDPIKLMGVLVRFLEQHRNPRFTRDLLLDRQDRVVAAGSLGFQDLGVVPTSVETKALNILRRYRNPFQLEEIIEVPVKPSDHGQ